MGYKLGNAIGRLLDDYETLGQRMLKTIKTQKGQLTGLRKGSSEMLAMYIKEIDILTPEKLRVIRRVRNSL